jgi:streptogramin lyase
LPTGNVLDIAFTPDGSVWVTTGLALVRFDGQAWTTYDSLINSVVVARDGSLWMNGWEGLQGSEYVALFDGKLWTTYKAADSFPGGFQLEAVTADGRLWGMVPGRRLASFDGGSWTDRDSWTFYEARGGLPLDGIQGLTQAPDGTLWTSMDNGVVRIDPLQDSDGGWMMYAAEDSLPGSHLGAMAFAPDGSIWFGATRFQPADAQGKP